MISEEVVIWMSAFMFLFVPDEVGNLLLSLLLSATCWDIGLCVSTEQEGYAGLFLHKWESVPLPKKPPISLCILGIYPVISLLFCYQSLMKLYCKPPQLWNCIVLLPFHCLICNNFKTVVFCIPLACSPFLSGLQQWWPLLSLFTHPWLQTALKSL